MQVKLPLETDYRQTDDFESCCRDFLHFHFAFSSHEQYLAVRIELFHFLGDGYGREDMTSCASAADDYSQCLIAHHFLVFQSCLFPSLFLIRISVHLLLGHLADGQDDAESETESQK